MSILAIEANSWDSCWAALAVVVGGDIWFTTLPFLSDVEVPAWVGMFVTVVFLVGVSNAVNLTDGLDGLAVVCRS